MKTEICRYLSKIVPGISTEEFGELMELPPEERLGDYALPCFALAKTRGFGFPGVQKIYSAEHRRYISAGSHKEIRLPFLKYAF